MWFSTALALAPMRLRPFRSRHPVRAVLAIQPQATLDPRLTEWDDRFTDMRIQDFTTRYGYAPDMLDAAEKAYVIYDPREKLDAMHAALFTRPNVDKLRMRFMGDALQTDLLEMGTWARLLQAVATGQLTPSFFAELYRARRDYRPYLRNLLRQLRSRRPYRPCRGPVLQCGQPHARPAFCNTLRRIQNARAQDQQDATDQD